MDREDHLAILAVPATLEVQVFDLPSYTAAAVVVVVIVVAVFRISFDNTIIIIRPHRPY